jgi:hypothetical protein
MTTLVAKLLAQKKELLDRLEQNPGPSEREEIEATPTKIEIALNLFGDFGTGDLK